MIQTTEPAHTSMSQLAWFGLSHNKAWSDVGQSFAETAGGGDHCSRSPQATGSQTAAGTLSSAKPKGAGSFQLQVYGRKCLQRRQSVGGLVSDVQAPRALLWCIRRSGR